MHERLLLYNEYWWLAKFLCNDKMNYRARDTILYFTNFSRQLPSFLIENSKEFTFKKSWNFVRLSFDFG